MTACSGAEAAPGLAAHLPLAYRVRGVSGWRRLTSRMICSRYGRDHRSHCCARPAAPHASSHAPQHEDERLRISISGSTDSSHKNSACAEGSCQAATPPWSADQWRMCVGTLGVEGRGKEGVAARQEVAALPRSRTAAHSRRPPRSGSTCNPRSGPPGAAAGPPAPAGAAVNTVNTAEALTAPIRASA